jgi:hypothetical protein
MTWYIRDSRQQLMSMADGFVEGPLRLILRGTLLEVKIEGCPETIEVVNRAERLAKSYIDHLGRILGEHLQLLTEDECCSLPPWASQNQAMAASALHQRGSHVAIDAQQALRDARKSVISYGWPLRDCYDYMQDATAADERFFPQIYKMIETMKNHLGDWATLRAKTDLATEITFLKQVANEEHRDERHASKGQTPPQPPTGAERVKARDFASRILLKFEELCRSEGRAG